MLTYKEQLCNYTFAAKKLSSSILLSSKILALCARAALLLARLPAACLTAVRVGRDFIRVIVEADEAWPLED